MISTTVQSALDDLVAERIRPVLRELGFAGSKRTYRRVSGNYSFTAKILKSPRNSRDLVSFTVEFYAAYAGSKVSFWWERIGQLMPLLTEFWWQLTTNEPCDAIADQVCDALALFARLALEALLETPGLPGGSLSRIWPRSFAGERDEACESLSVIEKFHHGLSVGQAIRDWPREELLGQLARDPVVRDMAILEILRRGLSGSDVTAALSERLERDPHPVVRGCAARALGALARGEEALGSLLLAASDDEDLDVRWSAEYALSLRRIYGEAWLNRFGEEWWRQVPWATAARVEA